MYQCVTVPLRKQYITKGSTIIMINTNLHSMLVSFECPQCKNSTSQTAIKIQTSKKLGCSVCCNKISISSYELMQKINQLA